MTGAELEQLIGPYLAGELDATASARVRAYLEETPGRQGIVAGVRAAIRTEDVGEAPEVAVSRERLMARLSHEALGGEIVPASRLGISRAKVPGGQSGWFGAQVLRNAAVAVTLGVGAIALMIFGRTHSSPAGATRIYTTRAGQQANLTLQDGSRVLLAPNSTLRLLAFGDRTRMLELKGEAYFTVARERIAPFVVRSGDVTARVLGTSFLVRQDDRTKHVHIAVEDGRVWVGNVSQANKGVTLSAGQFSDVTDSTLRVGSTEDLPAGAELVAGQLVFRHTELDVILHTLNRWYGYQFRYADQTLARQYVTIAVSTKSSAEALAAIEEVLPVNLAVVGDTVTLVPQLEQPVHGAPRVRTYDVWTPTREVGR